MSNIKIDQKDNTKYMSETQRYPITFEDCVKPMRFCDCQMCSFKPKRGANWKKCAMRVRMFLHEGGNII